MIFNPKKDVEKSKIREARKFWKNHQNFQKFVSKNGHFALGGVKFFDRVWKFWTPGSGNSGKLPMYDVITSFKNQFTHYMLHSYPSKPSESQGMYQKQACKG